MLRKAKRYAEEQQTSLSQLIEEYLKNITTKPSRETIVELVKGLEKPAPDPETDLKKQSCEEQNKPYGF